MIKVFFSKCDQGTGDLYRAVIIYSKLRVIKKIYAKILIVRRLMIISLCQSCCSSWLQQFHIKIVSFKWCIFFKKYFKRQQHVNELVSSISNCYNICKPYPFYSNLHMQAFAYTKPLLIHLFLMHLC